MGFIIGYLFGLGIIMFNMNDLTISEIFFIGCWFSIICGLLADFICKLIKKV